MDYSAIIEAMDQRVVAAFKAWGEKFAEGVKAALDERDAKIEAQAKQIQAHQEHIHALVKQVNEHQAALSGEAKSLVIAEAIDATMDEIAARMAVPDSNVSLALIKNFGTQKQVREALAEIPVPTYKGVFDRDAEYRAGDMVTYNGSVWHCNGSDGWAGEHPVPGKSKAWTLAVKCGRDGKDLTKDTE